MITTLINAKYPDVPPINATTKTFFSNIGEPLPTKLSKAQRIVSQFFSNIVNLSHEDRLAEAVARLQAIYDQAERSNS